MDEKHCVQLLVNPSRALVDEPFVVLVQNARPCCQMTVRSLHQCDDGHSWDAFAHYTSDATGIVNVSEDCSLGGTYSGIEPMGLLWSLRPVPGSKPGLRMRKKDVQVPMVVTISVYEGHRKEGFSDLVPLASAVVERWYMAPGVRRIPVTEHGLTATLFLPPGPGPFPAIMDLWGGGGQLVEYRAALLASHGIAAMAIDYLTAKAVSEMGGHVSYTYFETAYNYLEEHPQILSSRIAMLGLSFGTSVTLRMAAYSKVVKLRCAVCISGSHVQPVDKDMGAMMTSLNDVLQVSQVVAAKGHPGDPLTDPGHQMVDDMVEQIGSSNAALANATNAAGHGKSVGVSAINVDTALSNIHINEENQVIWRGLVLPIPTDPLKKVDVGRIQCPLMLIVGDDDQNWAAEESANDIKEMMERAGNSHLLTILLYQDAGHLIEPPYTPHARFSKFRSIGSDKTVMVLWGGQTLEHSRAQEDAWKKLLAFLRVNLFGGAKPVSHL